MYEITTKEDPYSFMGDFINEEANEYYCLDEVAKDSMNSGIE